MIEFYIQNDKITNNIYVIGKFDDENLRRHEYYTQKKRIVKELV